MNKKHFLAICLLAGVITISGCGISGAPRPRVGSFASNTMGVAYASVDSLGKHNYCSSLGESKAQVYTCKGGHIDLAHLRIASDHVYYLYNLTRKGLEDGKTTYKFNLAYDPTQYRATIVFPANFDSLSSAQREKIINEVSLELAQYYTWYLTAWHEIITWYGHGTFFPGTEFQSAFAWEDLYSNLLGGILGAKAIETADGSGTGPYNRAMTSILKDEMIRLGAVSSSEARKITNTVKGKWYSGFASVDMRMRNIDVGAGDGCVSPALIPDACPSASPVCQVVPTLAKAKAAGFKVNFEIIPDHLERSKVMPIIYGKGNKGPILPAVHLPIVAEHISQEAIERGYLVTK